MAEVAGSVCIIVPAYNEAEAIAGVVRGLRTAFPDSQLLVIDDGSTDKTGEVARNAGAEVLRHQVRIGYGGSLRTGIMATDREYVLFCDGDGQHGIDDVRRIMEAHDQAGMVVGMRDKLSHAALLRRPGKFILRIWANLLAGRTIPDINSGLRIVRRPILLRYMHLMPKGFSFSTTSTLALLNAGYPVSWIPITIAPRTGKSTVRQFRDGSSAMMLMLRLTVLFAPLRVFLAVAFIMSLLSIASFVFDMVYAPTQGLSDATVVLSISSILIFMSGLLCDQISALRREFHER